MRWALRCPHSAKHMWRPLSSLRCSPPSTVRIVIELWDRKPVCGIVMEMQLARSTLKRYIWPAYVANLRARLKCPVALLVVTADDAVARWAARPVEMGGLNHFTPYVVGPAGVPRVTSVTRARKNPELAVLSAMAHGRDADIEEVVKIAKAALSACRRLDSDRSNVYLDLILNALGEAARKASEQMDVETYEFQSEFARTYIAVGRAALIIRLLTRRFGRLDGATKDRIRCAGLADLDSIGERLLTAATLKEALGPGRRWRRNFKEQTTTSRRRKRPTKRARR